MRSLVAHSGFRYLITGGVSFVIDFGLVYLFHVVFSWQVWLATAIAFLTSFVFNYTAQRIFSFSSRAPHGKALLKYGLLVGANTVVTVAIVTALSATVMGWAGGKVVATIATTIGNYFAYRHWVFPAGNPTRDERV